MDRHMAKWPCVGLLFASSPRRLKAKVRHVHFQTNVRTASNTGKVVPLAPLEGVNHNAAQPKIGHRRMLVLRGNYGNKSVFRDSFWPQLNKNHDH